jgi:hypothetical protein
VGVGSTRGVGGWGAFYVHTPARDGATPLVYLASSSATLPAQYRLEIHVGLQTSSSQVRAARSLLSLD